ncbi:hypothetical protein ARAF_1638 [Arsenophonus endosymbiont of Aleurodicus floccissimus]|uniref:hypothetical protein n=1 Tax=Arsenophonus endosymbiont of Aleurodicus floccissimus TaxID=2152761 RepID=UPI000E6B4351|nr:hypothetical protein [Arsenophonus endosymbiont of Aleurodicus floccissimus]SPP31969.1 hypothetical protein ARAF_1638 [Arsenophonus endosymbiont of Aleurodicus floccissimus]
MKQLSKLFISIILLGYSVISMSTVFMDEQINDVEQTAEQNNATKSSRPISLATNEPDCSLPHDKRCYPRSTATDSVSITGTIKQTTIKQN